MVRSYATRGGYKRRRFIRRRAPYKRYKRRRGVIQNGRYRTSGYYGRYSYGNTGSEKKFHDITVNQSALAQGGTVQASITVIPQGVTEKTRVGRKLTITNINWRGEIHLNLDSNTATPNIETIRAVLVLDKQANGAAPAITDVFETDDYNSFLNLANSGRFKILMNKYFILNKTAGAGASTAANVWPVVQRRFKYNKKCRIVMEYDAATGAVTEVKSNNLIIMWFARSGSAADVDSNFRLRFSDK